MKDKDFKIKGKAVLMSCSFVTKTKHPNNKFKTNKQINKTTTTTKQKPTRSIKPNCVVQITGEYHFAKSFTPKCSQRINKQRNKQKNKTQYCASLIGFHF